MLPVSPSPVPPAVLMARPAGRRVGLVVLVVLLVLAVVAGAAVAVAVALRGR